MSTFFDTFSLKLFVFLIVFSVSKLCVSADTEVFIVASSFDVLSTAVYPTAPYAQSSPSKNITFLPDPCIFKVNGVCFGITATDIYNHILDAEVAV